MPFTKEQAAAYLAGLIDGEGTIGCYRKADGNSTCRVSICNTDTDIIAAAEEACKVLEFRYSVGRSREEDGRRFVYRVTFRGGYRTYLRIQQELPIRSGRKVERLQEVVASRKWPICPSRDTLHDLYHVQEKSIAEMAEILHCAPMTVYHWLCVNKIPRRSLASAGRLDWSKRGPRRFTRA